jgi:hypothetical protein
MPAQPKAPQPRNTDPTGPTPVDPDRDELNADEQQPDPKPDATPEGDEQPDEDKGAQPDADQAEDGADDDAADRKKDDTEDKTDWKAKYEADEQKRRDFESRAATAENQLKQWQEHATNVDAFWRRVVQKDAPELYERIVNEERTRQGQNRDRTATKDSSYAVIARVYREGDKPFADFLTTLVEDSDVRVTTQNIERHRATFNAIKGTAPANGNGHATPNTPPAPPRRGDPSRPPRVPSASRPPTGGDSDDEPWKPGQPFDVRGNLSRGMKRSAEQRRAR